MKASGPPLTSSRIGGRFRAGASERFGRGLPSLKTFNMNPINIWWSLSRLRYPSGSPLARIPYRAWQAHQKPQFSETRIERDASRFKDFSSARFSSVENSRMSPYSPTPIGSRSMRSARASLQWAASQADKPLISVTTVPSSPTIRAITRRAGSPLLMTPARCRAPRNSAMWR